MTSAQLDETTRQRPLRLWPGVVIVVLQWLARFVVPIAMPDAMPYGVMGGMIGGLAIILWWVFFSRARWTERLGAVVLMIAALAGTRLILHESIATGAMGMLFFIYAVPTLSLAFVLWAVATRHLTGGSRWATMAAAILLACGAWALVRTGGFTGGFDSELAWRWATTPEERLLAQAGDEPVAPAVTLAAADAAPGADWPGFRGPDRDDVVRGVRIVTDWATSPPVELWRRPVGPGWSSFAVRGGLVYTQEQRGEEEVVSCYDASSGEPVWRHADAARFWESNGGAGPRGTPSLHDGRVYTLGGTGIVNVLDAANGDVLWSRDAAADTGAKLPIWGFSGSPLVRDDLVFVAASGALIAYDKETGEPRWTGPAAGEGYSSPHLATFDGVPQILFLNGDGLTSVAPADGTVLWQHSWPSYPIVQPAVSPDGDVYLSVNVDSGTRRLAVFRGPDGWTAEERWTSLGLKPYFNDFVIHEGHAYGFDGRILACIGLADGERSWKGGRYGSGQLILLADQDVLLVLSEQGEVALVSATPDTFTELARFPAIEGKTWNHPVLAGDLLLVRNDREMAAFRLALAGS
jgi:outer membrane protein assembly factor BamB